MEREERDGGGIRTGSCGRTVRVERSDGMNVQQRLAWAWIPGCGRRTGAGDRPRRMETEAERLRRESGFRRAGYGRGSESVPIAGGMTRAAGG